MNSLGNVSPTGVTVSSDKQDTVDKLDTMLLNAYASSIAMSMARGAARGRGPTWQAVKQINEFNNVKSNFLLGDPSLFTSTQVNLPVPVQQAPKAITIDDIRTVINEELDARGVKK